ncbi:MAG: hypothetical protein LBI60_06245 [Bacteroidales bacterium]|jgi:hypothetical protein|nr:hypothetical protein [Bacteroidales bacterium]
MRHIRKISILIACLALILGACGIKEKGNDTPVEYYNVSFVCPAGWEVSDSNDYGASQSITVEKIGSDASGICIITLIDAESELDSYLQNFIDATKEQEVYSNLKFTDTKKVAYGQYEGLVAEYTASVLSLPHEGYIYVFHANGRSVCVLLQEATEDIKINESGFKKLRESFTIN